MEFKIGPAVHAAYLMQTHCIPNFYLQFIAASISHHKNFDHTLRPTTCVVFSSLLTPDTVTDGKGLKSSQRELTTNSTVPKTSHRSTGEAERLHLFNITARWVQCMDWKPHTCWCPRLSQLLLWHRLFHITDHLFNDNADFCSVFWQIHFTCKHWQHQMPLYWIWWS